MITGDYRGGGGKKDMNSPLFVLVHLLDVYENS